MAEKVRILLVDDEPHICQLAAARLEHEGYAVLIARDGQEALKAAREQRPDLVILDLMLPKMNGYEVCTLLKQDTRYQKIPILMFTAKAQEKDEKLGLECGADAYVRKPFDGVALLAEIRRLLAASSHSVTVPSKLEEGGG